MSWYEVLKKHDATVDRLTKERDYALLRCRMAAATLINEIGASGPEVLGVTASRAVAEIEKLRRERDEARAYQAAAADALTHELEMSEEHKAEVERLRAMVPTVAPPTVENIVRRYIEANGLDGLYNEEAECGCALDDLAPCSFIGSDCLAGVKVDGCTCGEGCDFHTVAAEEVER